MYVNLLFEANIKIHIKLSQEKEYQQIFLEVFFQSEDLIDRYTFQIEVISTVGT